MAANRESLASSPDLLGRSISDSTSSPAKRPVHVTPKKSETRQSRNIQLQDYYLTTPPPGAKKPSPSRSVTRQTENVISPWRIRVRVEAEREEGAGFSASPSRKSPTKSLFEKTTTTTIPLKSGDDTPRRRGRGRPRKSGTPAKRPGTPKPTRRESALSTQTENAPTSTPKRGRPRKQDSPNPRLSEAEVATSLPAPTNSTTRTRRSRRNDTPLMNIAVDSDATQNDHVDMVSEINEDFGDEHIYEEGDVSRVPRDESGPNTGTGSKTPLSELSSVSPQKGNSQRARFSNIRKDPTTIHSEFDSILEAEDMTMITLNSIPSAQRILHSGGDGVLEEGDENADEAFEKPLQNQAAHSPEKSNERHTESHVSSATTQPQAQRPVASTPGHWADSLLNIFKQATPSQMFSSPKLPPPMQSTQSKSPRALEKPQQGTPKLVKVVRAGIALQGVTTSPTSDSHNPAQQTSSRGRLDNLFSGFGVSTQRELRAGLRLGEELAKRQNQRESMQGGLSSGNSNSEDDVFQALAKNEGKSSPPSESYKLSVPRPKKSGSVEYPNLAESSSQPKLDVLGSARKERRSKGASILTESREENSKIVESKAPSAEVKDIRSSETKEPQTVHYPELLESSRQLPSPDDSMNTEEDVMDWQHDQPNEIVKLDSITKQQPSPESSRATVEPAAIPATNVPEANVTQPLTLAEQRELEYQRERDEISKQIRDANSSQVIVINSDDPTPSRLYADSEDEPMGSPEQSEKSTTLSSPAGDGHQSNPLSEKQDDFRPGNKVDVKTSPADNTIDVWQMEAMESSEIMSHPDGDAKTSSHKIIEKPIRAPRPQVDLVATIDAPIKYHIATKPPLSIYLPWNYTHYKRLNEIYTSESEREKHSLLASDSPLRDFLGNDVQSMGWRKAVEEWELVVVERFMNLLATKGINDSQDMSREKISPAEVLIRVFSLWVGRVQRGHKDLGDGEQDGYWDSRRVTNRKDMMDRSKKRRANNLSCDEAKSQLDAKRRSK